MKLITAIIVALSSLSLASPLVVKPTTEIAKLPVSTLKFALDWTPLFEKKGGLSEAELIAKAMGIVESGGRAQKGPTGEAKSVWQWLPATWNGLSRQYNREVNGADEPLDLCLFWEEAVVIWKVKKFMKRGYNARQIGMIWNTSLGGVEKPLVRQGIAKNGFRYDSVHHGQKVERAYLALR